jgi:hypothetical protein
VSQFKYLGTTVTDQNKFRRKFWQWLLPFSSEPSLFSSAIEKLKNIRIYKTIILPVVLYGCETWSLTLREEHTLMVFENRMLRRIFGLERYDVMAGWKKLHNEELCDLYFLPSIIKIIKSRKRHAARVG